MGITYDQSNTAIASIPEDWKQDPWQSVFRKLFDFQFLASGWDSYGGMTPALETCMRAYLLMKLWRDIAKGWGNEMPMPQVSPCGNGSIQVEWKLGHKTLELEIPDSVLSPVICAASESRNGSVSDYDGTFVHPDSEEAAKMSSWLFTSKNAREFGKEERHDPLAEEEPNAPNPAHSLVIGDKDRKPKPTVASRLARCSIWIYPPDHCIAQA